MGLRDLEHASLVAPQQYSSLKEGFLNMFGRETFEITDCGKLMEFTHPISTILAQASSTLQSVTSGIPHKVSLMPDTMLIISLVFVG